MYNRRELTEVICEIGSLFCVCVCFPATSCACRVGVCVPGFGVSCPQPVCMPGGDINHRSLFSPHSLAKTKQN